MIRLYLNDIKFHEHFFTHGRPALCRVPVVAIPDLTLTAGVKDAFFRMNLTQYADGHTIGNSICQAPAGVTLASSCTATTQHSQNYNSLLPSVEANYRVTRNRVDLRSVRPSAASLPSAPSSTPAGAETAVTPPPTIADTYQGGTVVKLNRFAFDADVYHIHFTNTYSTYTDTTIEAIRTTD